MCWEAWERSPVLGGTNAFPGYLVDAENWERFTMSASEGIIGFLAQPRMTSSMWFIFLVPMGILKFTSPSRSQTWRKLHSFKRGKDCFYTPPSVNRDVGGNVGSITMSWGRGEAHQFSLVSVFSSVTWWLSEYLNHVKVQQNNQHVYVCDF